MAIILPTINIEKQRYTYTEEQGRDYVMRCLQAGIINEELLMQIVPKANELFLKVSRIDPHVQFSIFVPHMIQCYIVAQANQRAAKPEPKPKAKSFFASLFLG